MKPFVHIVLCWIIIIISFPAFAQDIHFSQFFEAPLLRNPALAGLFSGDVRLQTVYRSQYKSVTVPFQTTSINGEFKKRVGKSQDFITMGGQLLQDKAGTIALTSTHILPIINYQKSLNEEKNMYLSLGFMGGYVQRRFDMSKVTTNSQYDGTSYNSGLGNGETLTNSSYSYFDGSAGLSFNTQLGQDQENNFFAGIAYHHFNKNAQKSFYNNSNSEVAPKWVYSMGAKMAATDDMYFTFHADYVQQGPYKEIIAGGILTYKLDDTENPRYFIHGGAFIRWNDAIIPMAKIEIKPLAISISYDANISKLSTASTGKGGFEMALSYQIYNNKNTSREAVRCPRF